MGFAYKSIEEQDGIITLFIRVVKNLFYCEEVNDKKDESVLEGDKGKYITSTKGE